MNVKKAGMKPVELSQRQHVTVRFGDQVLMDEDVYLGQLKLGNYTSVYTCSRRIAKISRDCVTYTVVCMSAKSIR